MPESVVSGEDGGNIVTHLSWEEQMELDNAKLDADKEGKSAKHPMGKKLSLTKVEESTKQFLWDVFMTTMTARIFAVNLLFWTLPSPLLPT